MRVLAAAALRLVAGPALAQDQSRPEIIRALCQKDGCDEFSVLKVDRIRADEEGALLQTRIRTFHSSSRGRVEKGEDTGFVFCSPTKPTILAQSQGKVAGFQIAMASTQESRETLRQQANFYAMYFTICHGPEAGRAAVHNLQGVAQQFGYRSPLAKSVMVTFTSPEEVFSKASARLAPQNVERIAPPRAQPESRTGDLLPPRSIPARPEHASRDQRVAERQEERVLERRVLGPDEEVVIVKKRRTASDETPWYREPQRWIEKLNPF
jgi:hypothetical protein